MSVPESNPAENSLFFRGLPDFDDDDFDEQLKAIAASDKEIRSQLDQFFPALNLQEKMALAVHAVVATDKSHAQLCIAVPRHKAYSPVLSAAIALITHLSPQALCELAMEILSDDWDLGLDAPSTLIE